MKVIVHRNPDAVVRSMRRLRGWWFLVIACIGTFAHPGSAMPAPAAPAEALRQLHATLRTPSAAFCRVEATISVHEGEAQSAPIPLPSSRILRDGEGRVVVEIGSYRAIVRPAPSSGPTQVHLLHLERPDRYLLRESEAPPLAVLRSLIPDLADPLIALRLAESVAEAALHWKSPGLLPEDLRESGEGRILRLRSDEAQLEIFLDGSTGLPGEIVHELHGGPFTEAGAVVRMRLRYEWAPIDPEALRELVHPDLEGRQRVETPASLRPQPAMERRAGELGIGDAAPALRGDLIGDEEREAFDLEAEKGRVTAILFWSGWCEASLEALQVLRQVQQWARDEVLDLRIVTVNCFELPAGGAEARRATLRVRLREQPLGMDVVLDGDDALAAAWGVRDAPVLFVLDGRGHIVLRERATQGDATGRVIGAVERALELAQE